MLSKLVSLRGAYAYPKHAARTACGGFVTFTLSRGCVVAEPASRLLARKPCLRKAPPSSCLVPSRPRVGSVSHGIKTVGGFRVVGPGLGEGSEGHRGNRNLPQHYSSGLLRVSPSLRKPNQSIPPCKRSGPGRSCLCRERAL